jgi:membrane dipeptidase
VIFSHANPRALEANGRNVTDEQIDACVATGGIVCANGVGRFLGDPEAGTPAILRHIDHLVQRIGPEHVGLGLDYEYHQGLNDWPPGADRSYWFPPAHGYGPAGPKIRIARPEQFPEITLGLMRLGYPEPAIRQILGENMLALARRVWPRRHVAGQPIQ